MSRKSKRPQTIPGSASGVAPGAGRAAAAASQPAAAFQGGPGLWGPQDAFEPKADASPVPVWLVILPILLVYFGMLHLDRYAGGFNQVVQGPYRSYQQLAGLQPKSGPEMLVAKGEAIYALMCLTCHQSTGLGSPGQYPPLAQSEWVLGSPNRLIRIPLHGLTGPIQVKGQSWNGSMPAFGTTPPLDSDENVAAVLTYIRQAWGNQAGPILPEQVKAVRAETSSRTTQWTAGELQSVPE